MGFLGRRLDGIPGGLPDKTRERNGMINTFHPTEVRKPDRSACYICVQVAPMLVAVHSRPRRLRTKGLAKGLAYTNELWRAKRALGLIENTDEMESAYGA